MIVGWDGEDAVFVKIIHCDPQALQHNRVWQNYLDNLEGDKQEEVLEMFKHSTANADFQVFTRLEEHLAQHDPIDEEIRVN